MYFLDLYFQEHRASGMPPEMHGPPWDVLTYIHPRSGKQHPLLKEGIKNIAGPWTKIEKLHRQFDLEAVPKWVAKRRPRTFCKPF